MEMNDISECKSHFPFNKDHSTVICIYLIVHTFRITHLGMAREFWCFLFSELCDVDQVTYSLR